VQLPTTYLKYRTWRFFTPVEHVLRACEELLAPSD
jgi:hypothetical protein